MKNWKNTGKRSLSAFLALVMCLGMVCTTAFAEGEGEGAGTVVCTKTEDCTAETHEADCPKYVAPEEPKVCETCGKPLTECEGHEKQPEDEPAEEPKLCEHEWDDGEAVEGGTKYTCALCGESHVLAVEDNSFDTAFADDEEQTEAQKLHAARTLAGGGSETNPYMVTLADLPELGTLLESATDTVYVKAAEDISLPNGMHIKIPNGATVDLDFNSHTLTKTDVASEAPIENYGTITLHGNGGISGANRCINNYGTMTIDGGTYTTSSPFGGTAVQNKSADSVATLNGGTVNAASFAVYNMGTMTVNGGEYKSTSCNHIRDDQGKGDYFAYCFVSANDLTFNAGQVTGVQGALAINSGKAQVKGGTFTTVECPRGNGGACVHYAIYSAGERGNVDVTISGGEFTAYSKVAAYIGNDNDGGLKLPAAVKIIGGSFTGGGVNKAVFQAPTTGNLEVSGGTFSGDVSNYVDPASVSKSENGQYVVTPRTENDEDTVAQVGEKFYASLQAAVDAAEHSNEQVTVTLLADTTEKITVSGGDIVLDLNGKKISNTDNFEFTTGQFDVFFGAITVTGGKLTIDDTSADKTGQVLGDAFAVVVKDGLLTVNNGSFGYASEESDWWEPLFVGGGSAVINGGFFFGGTLEYYHCYPDAAEGSLLVNGGRFDALPLYIAANQGAPIWAPNADGYVVAYKTYGDFAADNAASFTYDSGKNVLQMTGAYNKSATRTDPLSGFFINGDVILDLNGQAWTMENANLIVVNENTTLTVRDSAGNGVIENKTQVVIETLGTLNIEGGTLSTANAYNNVVAANGNCTINITGGKLEGKSYGIISKNVTAGREERTINISGGEFNTNAGFFNRAYNEKNAATVSVSGGTFKKQPEEQYIATGLETKENGDGTFSIVIPNDKVAQIVGGGAYKTLAGAIAAAKSGDTVKLLANASGAGVKMVAADKKNVIIDLGGHTYDAGVPLVGSTGYESQSFHFEASNTVTLKNGTIKSGAPIVIQNYCDLTLENLTIEGTAGAQYAVSCNAGNTVLTNVNISGVGDFTALDVMHWHENYAAPTMTINNTEENVISGKIDVYCYNNGDSSCGAPAKLEISGGTFSQDVANYCTTGNTTYSATGGNYVVAANNALSITANNTSLTGGGTVTLTVTRPAGTTGTVTSNPNVTMNGSNGTYTVSLPNTTATYTFTAAFGGKTATCTVTVTRYTYSGGGSSSGGGYRPSGGGSSSGGGGTVNIQDPDVPLADLPLVFTDVDPDAYYVNAVKWAVQEKITSGTSSTTFSPNATCTRAQMVTFLWRAAGSPAPKSGTNPFTDVVSGAYYYDAVLWAVEQGITSGTSKTMFSPDAKVTRGQSVTFLYRAAGSPAVNDGKSFDDVDSSAFYAKAVQWAAEKGVTSGTTKTTFSPGNNCTRAQIVSFLYRDRVS